jgi:hypothetical protein
LRGNVILVLDPLATSNDIFKKETLQCRSFGNSQIS